MSSAGRTLSLVSRMVIRFSCTDNGDSCIQPLSLRQSRLPIVESPEARGFEFQGAGHVQAIQRPQGQTGPVFAGKIGAEIKGTFGHEACLE